MIARADLDATLKALQDAAYRRGWDDAMRRIMAHVAQLQAKNTGAAKTHPAGESHPAESGRAAAPVADLTKRERAVHKALYRFAGQPARPRLREISDLAKVPLGSLSFLLERLVQKGAVRRQGQPGAYWWVPTELAHADDDAASHKPAKPRSNARTRPFRRFDDKPGLDPENVKGLAEDHPAVTEGRTLFPTTVVDPADSPRLLISGGNSRKLGDRVVKGPWAGSPIYQLTLEERATCPRSCHHWASCYGSGMPLARRHRHGPELEAALSRELSALANTHETFVVRLHVLGDFYSVEYVEAWAHWLEQHPGLRVFGFTAWPRESDIGRQIQATVDHFGFERFAIRFSSEIGQPGGVTTLWQKPEDAEVPDDTIICPAQTGRTDCCGSCGLCWSPAAKDKTIAFIAHGGLGRNGRVPKETQPAQLSDNTPAQKPWPAEREPVAKSRPVGRSENPVDSYALPQTVQRRCQGCGAIFKTSRVDHTVCGRCPMTEEVERQRACKRAIARDDNTAEIA